ncbi:Nicotinamidase-related amidase [Mariprofundus ferrinatatus]|uniref:Nicotinamidase-related amidase n=1 Tax=Mariprofundus ferrinatatus TaxID=1921087 RepID=A0A2K8L654_9PROT|nr:cysteine hydrolase family protein [Mariprofundus ferrinatatus]ATX82723.1 Nicotinamidase-related amidase [Mariprofundus ferrinatatus]
MHKIKPSNSALILIGYQNDYFSEDGILRKVIEESDISNNALQNSLAFIRSQLDTGLLMIHTPIVFTKDYSELVEPVGILAAIKQFKAFQAGEIGCKTIPEIKQFDTRIQEIPGKRGLNAFSNTDLEKTLNEKGIRNIILAGAVTSICIDSTGRAAFEHGYNVIVLEDCTCGRTNTEQDFFCKEIFPLYATVMNIQELGKALKANI